MPYITNADIELRVGHSAYVQLADDDGDGAADTAVVDAVRDAAEGEIDGFLAGRYQTPIDLSAHPELTGLMASLALDVAEYRLRLRRPPVAPDIGRRYEQTVEWLRRLATGVIQLPTLATASGPTAGGVRAKAIGEPRVLTRDELSAH